MKAESSENEYDPVTPGERWIDAALSEHARLGRDGVDDELILRILQETIHRPTRACPISRISLDWKMVGTGLTAVAALVALILVVLSSLPVEPGQRRSDELRFVVSIDAPADRGAVSPGPPRPLLTGRAHTGKMDVVTPATTPESRLSLARVDLELVSAFAPTFDELPRKGVHREDLRITADHGTSSSMELVYEGDVLVEHEQFRIEADSVRVPVPGAPSQPEQSPLLARKVRVVQSASDCVAEAETLRFDPISGSLVLTGVTRVETGQGLLARFAPADRLILSGGGYSVERAPVENHASIPLQIP